MIPGWFQDDSSMTPASYQRDTSIIPASYQHHLPASYQHHISVIPHRTDRWCCRWSYSRQLTSKCSIFQMLANNKGRNRKTPRSKFLRTKINPNHILRSRYTNSERRVLYFYAILKSQWRWVQMCAVFTSAAPVSVRNVQQKATRGMCLTTRDCIYVISTLTRTNEYEDVSLRQA
jgi:hypothetical protein